jgi:hypothetical protein
MVGELLRHLIETDDARLRIPVGPDALVFLGWRKAGPRRRSARPGAPASGAV